MFKILFLLLLVVSVQYSFAVDFFNGILTSETYDSCDHLPDEICLDINFDYINPKTSSVNVEVEFTLENAEFIIEFQNNSRRAYRVGFSDNAVTVYDSLLNPLYNETIEYDFSESINYLLILNYTPEVSGSIGGIVNFRISDSTNNVNVYQSPDMLGILSYMNHIEMYKMTNPPLKAPADVMSWKISVSKTPIKNVVVIPF